MTEMEFHIFVTLILTLTGFNLLLSW